MCRVNIVRHLKTHGKGLATVYKCEDCTFQTIHKTNFNTHVWRHKNPEKIKMFECQVSLLTFSSSCLHKISKQHCPHKTPYKASLRAHLKLHMPKEGVETYACKECDFVTLYDRSYKLHMLNIHNSDHPAIEYYRCTFCNFKTRYRENCRRHEKGHAKGALTAIFLKLFIMVFFAVKQNSYNCLQCSFITVQPGRFEKHLLVHHKDLSN